MNTYNIKSIWWLWVPLAFLCVQCLLEATLSGPTMGRIMSEDGPHETLQAFVIFGAFCVAVSIALRFPFKQRPWLGAWVILAAICCFYVAGEEISWGQWIFHWATPDYWSHINDQDETNLHNTSTWLDQKPRLMLELGVLVGGLIFPTLQRYKPGLLPQRFNIIYPSAVTMVIAGIDAFFKLSNVIGHHVFHVDLYARVAEVTELCMYYFTLMYLIVLKRRIFGVPVKKSALAADQ